VSHRAVGALREAFERDGVLFREGAVGVARSVGFAQAEDVFSGLSAPESPFGQSDHMGQNYQPARLTGAQIRAGRALLRWSAEDLARRTALGVNTIRRAELADTTTALTAANELAIRQALEAAGVLFIEENGGGPGVRLRNRRNAKRRPK